MRRWWLADWVFWTLWTMLWVLLVADVVWEATR